MGDLQGTTATDDFNFSLGLVDQEKMKTSNEMKMRQMRQFEGLMTRTKKEGEMSGQIAETL